MDLNSPDGDEMGPIEAEGTSNPLVAISAAADPWLKDLIRRAYTQGNLSDADVVASAQILLAEYGLAGDDETLVPEPLTDAHLPPTTTTALPVVLNAIANVHGVNRLAEDQVVGFATTGVTVIFGDNASGKSGYTRLLKRLCRARTGAVEPILPDVFAAGPRPTAEAEVRFTIGGGNPQTAVWQEGTDPPADLSRLSVFDARAIPVYADQQNEMEFLPYHLDVLPEVVRGMHRVASSVDRNLAEAGNELRNGFPFVVEGTSLEYLARVLAPDGRPDTLPTDEDIDGLAAFGADQQEQLRVSRLALAENDPSAAGSRRSEAIRLRAVAARLQPAEELLSDVALTTLAARRIEAAAAREAAEIAAATTFDHEPLPRAGTDAWRLMYQYARDFSSQSTPGQSFPPTHAGAVCPLCMQELQPSALDRFARFEAFVRAHAAAEATRLQTLVNQAVESIRSVTIPTPESVAGLEISLETQAGGETVGADSLVEALAQRRLAAIEGGELATAIHPFPASVAGVAESRATELDSEATAIEGASNPTERTAIESRVRDLTARSMAALRTEELKRRRDVAARLHALRSARRACDTTGLSRAATELRRRYLTRAYAERLQAECEAIGLGYLPLRIEDRTEHGVSYIRVALTAPATLRNREVLSDGEYRGLALACFLAEVSEVPGHSGIVVDDPVSSLDQTRTVAVARRLVREALGGRQVIVFTHDLVFLEALRTAAAKDQVPMISHWLTRGANDRPGVVKPGEDPWQIRRVRTRVGDLRVAQARLARPQDRTSDDYRGEVTAYYAGLRETWERLVEELLLNGVVGRFQLGVATQSLKGVDVGDGDYATTFHAMARVSTYSGHDTAVARHVALPSPAEMLTDLEELDAYATAVTGRRDALQARRRRLEDPPAGELA